MLYSFQHRPHALLAIPYGYDYH